MDERILILDFGGQDKERVARTIRGWAVYSEIKPGNIPLEEIQRLNPIGIILTGGPNSIDLPESLQCHPDLFELGIPILGLGYGMHIMCGVLGGSVVSCQDSEKKRYCMPFSPQSKITEEDRETLRRFLYDACGASGNYKLEDYIDTQIQQIRQQVDKKKVLLALSGGVDSSVCARLLSQAIPGQLVCLFVDHGFMRLNEGTEIENVFSPQDVQFIRVNAQDRFLAQIKSVTDPEVKRKRIGEEFIRVFEEEAGKLGDIPFLAQGTIYPDIVESGGEYGAVVKSHHNVGGLPKNLAFSQLVEPLSGLFKDEVREVGKILGLPDFLIQRQPFPGPGLAVRVIGEVTKEKLETLRLADAIFREELGSMPIRPDQYFAILTDTLSVGVKNNARTFHHVIALRAVETNDFMTCRYSPIPHEVLSRAASRITDEIDSISRVVYDITSKPPATIEWE